MAASPLLPTHPKVCYIYPFSSTGSSVTMLNSLACISLILALAYADHRPYKICVPYSAMDACHSMEQQGDKAGVKIKCIPARDRIECISKIKEHAADFEAVDPEDMYLASKLDASKFSVFEEIRTKEEPNAEFRYDGVAVVPTNLPLENIKSLKGLRSCHTGVGRNVGYKIPITKLTNMGILGPLNDVSLSPRENELKALSKFFSKACIVGTWSPHQETNARLKSTYSNLCELCEHPDKCDYPDNYSGYDGALRCLTKGGGQVAWTKVIYVKKHFGMAYGSHPAAPNDNDPSLYSYLCPDGSRKPVTGPPCAWASRPWQGYMADTQIGDDLKELSKQIQTLNEIGEKTHADWITKVLTLSNTTLAVSNTPVDPLKYLQKAKYYDVIEKDGLEPKRSTRICVTEDIELSKCETFAKAAFSRDIRPKFSCIKKEGVNECLKALGEKHADMYIADPQDVIKGEKSYKVKPVLHEVYGNGGKQVLVAVVKEGSSIKSIGDLKGKKACLPKSNNAGYIAVIKYLLDNKHLLKTHCPHETALKEFFSNIQQSENPVDCLLNSDAEVAFMPHSSADHYMQARPEKLDVICNNGERKPIKEGEQCGLYVIPPKMVVTSADLPVVVLDEVRSSMLAASNLYSQHPEYFKMFGEYDNKEDVLFTSAATKLETIVDTVPSYEEYKKTVEGISICN